MRRCPSPRPAIRLLVLLAAVAAATIPGAAHVTGKKQKVPIALRDAKGPAGPYRIAAGCIPPMATAGQVVRCEVKALAVGAPLARRPVTVEAVEGGRPEALDVEEEGGAYAVEHAFEQAGDQELRVRFGTDEAVSFPVRVQRGNRERFQWGLAALVLILGGAVMVSAVRRRQAAGERWAGQAAGYAVATAVAVAVAVWVIAPFVGHRADAGHGGAAVDWSAFEPPHDSDHPEDSGAAMPRDGHRPPASHEPPTAVASAAPLTDPWPAGGPVELTGRVAPRPGAVVDVLVPVSGRVVIDPNFVPVVGRHVAAGQTLVRLEQHYVMHDAVHLLNERWPILNEMLTAKRRSIEAQARDETLRALYKQGGVAEREVQQATATAAMLTRQSDRWRNQLALHDAQIAEADKTVRPLVTPIAGTIAASRFTQGQLVYEGDKLFTVVDLSSVWIEVDVPEAIAARVRRDVGHVQLSVGPRPADTLTGRFIRSGEVVSAETRTVPFYFQVANPDDRLVFGMTVTARFQAPARSGDGLAATAGRTPRTIRAVGTVQADPRREAEVVAPMWGRIEWAGRPLAVGDVVKKDQELIRLLLELPIAERYAMSTRLLELRAAVDVAEKRVEQAGADYRRAVGLMRASPAEPLYKIRADWAERLLGAAREEQKLVTRQTAVFEGVMKRRDPKTTPVTAPIAGTIVEVAFTPGGLDLTQEFRKLLTIADLTDVWLAADVFERDLDAIRRPGRATFTTPAGPTRPLGAPIAISPFVDEHKRTVKVIFQVPNPKGTLRLGGFATLSFDVE